MDSHRRRWRIHAHAAGQPCLGMPRSYLRPSRGTVVGSLRVRAGAAGAETAPPRTAAQASWRASPPPPPKLASASIWLSRCTHAGHARTATRRRSGKASSSPSGPRTANVRGGRTTSKGERTKAHTVPIQWSILSVSNVDTTLHHVGLHITCIYTCMGPSSGTRCKHHF